MALTNKERMQIKRHPMPTQDPKKRINNFYEVSMGYDPETARREAERCLQCAKPGCVIGCPISNRIPQFVHQIAEGNFAEAAKIIRINNTLPEVCGRVCPQEVQCEGHCVLAKRGEAVAIGNLERFATDWERQHNTREVPEKLPKTGKRVAIVGSGPGGLTAALELTKLGHEATVFEALHKVGGVPLFGIPEYRLPKEILDDTISHYYKAGVIFRTNVVIGKTIMLEELRRDYDAVFIAVGEGYPTFLNVPGEYLNGVCSSNDFLTRVNLMKAFDFPITTTPVYNLKDKTVAVFGGGNTAMDTVRTAMRLGAKRAMIIYRRTEAELPARLEEIHHAKEEGVEFHTLLAPIRFNGDGEGNLVSVSLQVCELGEPDSSGRRRPMPIEGKTKIEFIDSAIIAVGNSANPLFTRSVPELKKGKWDNIEVDKETYATNLEGVYAGGDIVTGASTVCAAMHAAQVAAKSIHAYLTEKE